MIKVTMNNNVTRVTVMAREDATLRETLESSDIDYSTGILSLDGNSLGVGDIDKTFAQLGITDHCFLMKTVKTDNAAKVVMLGNNAFIISSMKLEDLSMVEKFGSPDALTLYKEKEPIFAVGIMKSGEGSANANGILFDSQPNAEGYAIVKLPVTEPTADEIANRYGKVLVNLNKVESKFAENLTAVTEERSAIMENIVVM